MRIRSKELKRARKKKEEAYKLRTHEAAKAAKK